jgi:hypothetical protein
MMVYRTFRPTVRSFLPEIFQILSQGCFTTIWWLGYFYRPTIPQLTLAVLVTLCQLYFVYLPAAFVAVRRVTVGPYGVRAGPVGRERVLWRDIHEVRIFERYRPWRGTRRTDRVIRLHTCSNPSLGCNPSAWPRQDEDEFLDTLEKKSREYGFRFLRKTTRI